MTEPTGWTEAWFLRRSSSAPGICLADHKSQHRMGTAVDFVSLYGLEVLFIINKWGSYTVWPLQEPLHTSREPWKGPGGGHLWAAFSRFSISMLSMKLNTRPSLWSKCIFIRNAFSAHDRDIFWPHDTLASQRRQLLVNSPHRACECQSQCSSFHLPISDLIFL